MIYFLSDAHLGSRLQDNPHEQERRICRLLDRLGRDATAIYFMGDMFDFWYDYRYVVPKGFVRFMGKVAELTDRGIEIHFFAGNHDQWDYGYWEQELGVKTHYAPEVVSLNGRTCLLAHGDGLGVRTRGERWLNSIFHNRLLRHLFRGLHPTLGMSFGLSWSASNRRKETRDGHVEYLGEDREWLVQYAKEHELQQHLDYYIFGHRHILLDLELATGSRVVILGDLIRHFSYAQIDADGRLSIHTDDEG